MILDFVEIVENQIEGILSDISSTTDSTGLNNDAKVTVSYGSENQAILPYTNSNNTVYRKMFYVAALEDHGGNWSPTILAHGINFSMDFFNINFVLEDTVNHIWYTQESLLSFTDPVLVIMDGESIFIVYDQDLTNYRIIITLDYIED